MKLGKTLGKKVNFEGLRPSSFSKFSPAALKKKKKSGLLGSKFQKMFACGAEKVNIFCLRPSKLSKFFNLIWSVLFIWKFSPCVLLNRDFCTFDGHFVDRNSDINA